MASVTTSITAYSGRDFLIKVSDPDVSPSVFFTLGGLRSGTITINDNPVDITNVASGGFQEWLADGGVFSASVSGDGVYDGTGAGSDLVKTAAVNRTYLEVQVNSGAGDFFVMDAVVESFERSASYDDAEAFTVSFNSHGPVDYHAGP